MIDEVYKMTETKDLPTMQKILSRLHTEAISKEEIGIWTSYTGTAAVQATTNLIISAWVAAGLGENLDGLSDSANPPTTRRAYIEADRAGTYIGITFGCKKGDYFRLNTSGASTPNIMTFSLGG